jgi:hypothetical protein
MPCRVPVATEVSFRAVKLYGALDLAFAALYAWFGFVFTPGRSTAFNLALALVCALLAAAGAGLLVGARWGRTLALAACALLLAFAAVVIIGLVASSAYLRGVYGPLGQGMAVMSLLVAALVVEAFALLPLFQLRFLLGQRRA